MDAVLSPDTSVGTKVAVKLSCCCALARQRTFGPVQHRAGLQVPKLEVLKSSSHCCLQEALQKRYQTLRRSVDPTESRTPTVMIMLATFRIPSGLTCFWATTGGYPVRLFFSLSWLTALCLMTQWKACCRKADPGVQRPAAGAQCLWRSMKGARFSLLLIEYRRLFSKASTLVSLQQCSMYCGVELCLSLCC